MAILNVSEVTFGSEGNKMLFGSIWRRVHVRSDMSAERCPVCLHKHNTMIMKSTNGLLVI